MGAMLLGTIVGASALTGNVHAQFTADESRIMQSLLALSEFLKRDVSDIQDVTDNILRDLQFKKKFYQIKIDTTDIDESQFDVTGDPELVTFVMVMEENCSLPTEDCAFNVESVQFRDNGNPVSANVTAIEVDGVITDLSGKEISTPTNLMVDSGIGKLGASEHVAVYLFDPESGPDAEVPFSGTIEINGEKPQGMDLCIFISGSGGEATNCFLAPPG
jgi:hypothetical protein